MILTCQNLGFVEPPNVMNWFENPSNYSYTYHKTIFIDMPTSRICCKREPHQDSGKAQIKIIVDLDVLVRIFLAVTMSEHGYTLQNYIKLPFHDYRL